MKAVLGLLAILACAGRVALGKPSVTGEAAVTPKIEIAVKQAIQDEIYDEGCQGYGFDAAAEHGKTWYRLPLYITPQLDGNEGEVIYKLLPLGEVIRVFSIEGDGLARLYGHPEWRFPPTGPDFLTVYMNDDDLCKLKHEWTKVEFTVDLKPSAEQLREAEQRQKRRLGSEYRPHKRDCSFRWREE